MKKSDFAKCGICGAPVKKLEFDSPLYCDSCIERMEKENLSAKQLKKEREIEETLKK